MLCICCAIANAHKYSFAVNNAVQNADSIIQKVDSAAGNETDSLDIKKSKIVEELTVKRDSTVKDVVKTFIDASIDDIINATDTATLDSISQLILAKVDGCLNVEAKEKATLMLDEAEQDSICKSYTDIINAPNLERVKALTNDAIGVIDLRETKNEKIAAIAAGVAAVPKDMIISSDEEKLAKYTDDINKATKKIRVVKAYEEAMALVAAMATRSLAIEMINKAKQDKKLTAEDEKVINEITQDIANSDDLGKIALSVTSALVHLNGEADMEAAFNSIIEALTSNPRFEELMNRTINRFFDGPDKKKLDKLLNNLVETLSIAALASWIKESKTAGKLANKQKGPAIVLTDQEGNDFRFYGLKSARITEER